MAAAHGALTAALVERWRAPEGPLALLFVGYPLWWLLGVVQPVVLVVSGALVVRLVRDRAVVVPRGFGWWALFLVWVAAGALVLQVDVPGALPGGSGTRYLTWAVRLLWFLEATVVLLYVGRRQVSPQRLVRVLAWMFVTVVAGGLLGTLAPTLRLTAAMELVLPGSLMHQAFIGSLVHPILAERHVYLDTVQFRPSGPFPYSNAWGLNYACFLPFFLAGWLGPAAGWRRVAAPAVLVCSIVPVVYSGNRGLWLVIGVLAALLVVKQAAAGRLRPLLWAGTGAVLAVAIVLSTPLYGALEARFTGHTSNVGRMSLTTLTIDGVAASSPVIGVGTTRTVQGSFYSIAGGATPACPLCTPPALGTQGFLWLMLFGTGFVGCALGLAFWLGPLRRHRARRAPIPLACLAVLVAFVLTLPIYDWSITAAFAAMAAIGLLERDTGRSRVVPLVSPPRAGVAVVVGCVLAGAAAGGAVAAWRGPTYVARAAIYLPTDPHASGSARLDSLDSEARWVRSPRVLAPSAALQALDRATHRGTVSVDATANTRILGISYSSTSAERARKVAGSLATALLADRADRTAADRAALVASVQRQLTGSARGSATIERTAARLRGPGDTVPLAALADADVRVRTTADTADQAVIDLTPLADLRGHVVGPVSVRADRRWNVALGSGGLVGLLLAVAPGRATVRRAPRASRSSKGVPRER